MLDVGSPAPDFTVQNHRGETVKLSETRGRPVVLWFYPKADTPGCTKEGCGIRDQKADFEGKQVRVFGVSYDGVEDNRAFAEKFSFPFELLCDTDRSIARAYGAFDPARPEYARRISYVIDAEGAVAAVFDPVTPEGHAAELLKAV